MTPKVLLPVVLLASTVAAQKLAPVWSQCGGSAFAGPTACASGNYCSFGNPWYSQCLPGSADDPLQGGIPDSPLETNTVQTIITIGGNNGNGNGNGGDPPVTITTSYTFLLPSTTILATHHHLTSTPGPSAPPAPPAPPAPTQGGGSGEGDGAPLLTVIGGTTYTIIQDPPATGNNKRTVAVPAVAPRVTTLYNEGRPLVADSRLQETPAILATPTAKWTTIVTVAEKKA
ncbi:hypothetical protein SCUCBS95973_004050 [Sporothrix curviconia]|uniref:CBM1 domain-containing protein n=1 Tax=Sporothrix curviconia TaxID=1260050 RepID=A0ABP0BKK5_9PEZI